MKKQIICGLLTSLTMLSATAKDPMSYPGFGFNGVSPDGNYAVAYAYGFMGILDVANSKEYTFDDMYGPGTGNFVSNTGVVVGFLMTAEEAQYWKNGKWQPIKDATKFIWSYANGITPDGKRIVGSVNTNGQVNYEGTLLVPCYWDLQPDGTYGITHILPHPTEDFIGRKPTYITAIRVSDDGKTIAGQVQDYSGDINEPIIYTQKADGTWEYKLLANELFHPEGVSLPEWPGDGPSLEEFMSSEELAKFTEALQEWEENANMDYSQYPDQMSYMTEEEKEAYYQAEYQWSLSYPQWEKEFRELVKKLPKFGFNNVLMNGAGTIYATTASQDYIDPVTYLDMQANTPYVININNNSYVTYPQEESANVMLSAMAEDGTLLGQVVNQLEGYRDAYILTPGSKSFKTLASYVSETNPTMYSWMKENMTHEVLVWDDEAGNYLPKSIMSTGIPFCTPDMGLVALNVETYWVDMENPGEDYYPTYGYLLGLNTAGVESLVAEPNDGTYRVYNLHGMKVMETKEASQLNTLPKGIYIINGKKVAL